MNRQKIFSKKNFEHIKKCEVCGDQKSTFFLRAPDRNFNTGIFTYVKCRKCDFIWLSPRPKKQILDKYYPPNYSAYRAVPRTDSVRIKFRNFLKTNSLIAHFLIKDRLFFWKTKGKILDVGTGNGSYMQILTDWGWQTFGVEINPHAVNQAKKKGIKSIRAGDLMSAHFTSNFFNVIRFSHVLEHVPSPKKELVEAKRILKKNGHVVILIPNIDSLFFHIFQTYWYSLEAPRHFYHFNPKTIRKILSDCGFIDIRIYFNQSPYPPLWSLMYVLGIKKIERRNILFGYPFGLLLRVINLLKKSDILEVVAFKP